MTNATSKARPASARAAAGSSDGIADEPRPNSAVGRALGLLRRVATLDGERSLTELSEVQGLSRSVTYKLLQVLVAEGLVDYEPTRKRYRPGLGLYGLASAILQRGSFVPIARTIMRELVADTGESACLNLLDTGNDLFTVAAVEESVAPLQYVIELGQMHPLHAGASGKAILAFRPPADVRRVLSRRLEPVTSHTVTDRSVLREQLGRIRELGYCVSRGERLEGSVGIAAPIVDRAGLSVGSVQVTIPTHRFRQKDTAALGAKVRGAAERVSEIAQAMGTER